MHRQRNMAGLGLGMEGLLNARQLGGYAAEDGRMVRQNLLLRSAKLSDATENDLARLRDVYHLRTIVDLRTPNEAQAGADPQIDGARNIRIQMIDASRGGGQLVSSIPGATVDIDATIRGMLALIRGNYVDDRLYIRQLDSETGKTGCRQFFDALLTHEDGAVLWHCTSGKDRTGVAAVLLLTVLGVDKETAIQDFLLSNDFHKRNVEYIAHEARRFTSDPSELETMRMLAGVSRVYMEKMFAFAEEKHGSMLEYIRREIGMGNMEIRTIRDKYLI